MSWRVHLLLFLIGLSAVSIVAVFQHAPGYVDAEYYYAGGLRLATGHGFSELILWNYLDDPSGLPHPSHAYWMPFASIIAALGMRLTGLFNFYGARLGFILLAACIPPLTASLSYSLTGSRVHAILAGLLAAFPPFYLSYLGTTDNFGLYLLLGAIWFHIAGARCRLQVAGSKFLPSSFNLQPLILGTVAGLLHLSRNDGILWLLISLVAVSSQPSAIGHPLSSPNPPPPLHASRFTPHASRLTSYVSRITFYVPSLSLVLLGYLLIMGPWMLRNLSAFGTLLSPGGARALWLTDYNELYSYPASLLSPQRWWASGLREILRVRLDALWQNAQSAFAVQGAIFLTPLILFGLWRLRKDRRVQLGLLAWLMTFTLMTVVFPHQGWRGGFFHSGAALQALFWAVAPVGLEVFIDWGVRVRKWQAKQARAFFGAGLVGLALMLASVVVYGRVVGPNTNEPHWNSGLAEYRRLEKALQEAGASPGEAVAVNNPPGFFVAAGRPAISIPDGDESGLLAAARRYEAHYVLLEYNHPRGLDALYQNPADRPGLKYFLTVENTHIFRVE